MGSKLTFKWNCVRNIFLVLVTFFLTHSLARSREPLEGRSKYELCLHSLVLHDSTFLKEIDCDRKVQLGHGQQGRRLGRRGREARKNLHESRRVQSKFADFTIYLQRLFIFGRDVSEIPCFRSSFLYGGGSAFGFGIAAFLATSRPQLSCHCAMAGFVTVTMSYWFYCR